MNSIEILHKWFASVRLSLYVKIKFLSIISELPNIEVFEECVDDNDNYDPNKTAYEVYEKINS